MARALCTLDSEGQCYACERKKANYEEGWKTKTNLYINALVDYNGKGDPKVVVISRNFNSPFAQKLMDIAVEEGTITNTVFKITKYGSGTQLVWTLDETKKPLFKSDGAEVHNLNETVLRDISYEKQPEYFGRVWDGAEPEEKAAEATSTASEDVEW
jgi:hypothetical protein